MQHLMLDLYHCKAKRLTDAEHLLRVLTEYPAIIGMEAAGPPVLRDIVTNNPLDDGMSGVTIIFTSHVSLHSWPPYGMVNLDIFSCNVFDQQKAIAFAQEMFETEDIEIHQVERATRSPRDAFLMASVARRS